MLLLLFLLAVFPVTFFIGVINPPAVDSVPVDGLDILA